MTAPKKPSKDAFHVTQGTRSLRVYRWTHPSTGKRGYRFTYQPEAGGEWKYVTRSTRPAITEEAERVLKQLAQGIVWTSLPADRRRFLEAVHRKCATIDEAAVLAFLDSRASAVGLADAVSRFIAAKSATKGRETRHIVAMRRDLEALAEAFPGKAVHEISTTELETWWLSRSGTAETARKKAIRTTLVTFWKWAQLRGLAGSDPNTPAKLLPSIEVRKASKTIFTPAELRFVLDHVRPDFRAWVVLGAFAGIRPEEIAPDVATAKPGLACEEIDHQFKVIRLSEETSKGGKRARIIPISENLQHWLQWAGIKPGMKGPVCRLNPATEEETLRLGKLLKKQFPRFTGWPQDALRHSYGSYRNALIRDLGQVAEEMGTSVRMLHSHYHNPQPVEEGRNWFSILPAVPTSSDGDDGRAEEIAGKSRKSG